MLRVGAERARVVKATGCSWSVSVSLSLQRDANAVHCRDALLRIPPLNGKIIVDGAIPLGPFDAITEANGDGPVSFIRVPRTVL